MSLGKVLNIRNLSHPDRIDRMNVHMDIHSFDVDDGVRVIPEHGREYGIKLLDLSRDLKLKSHH